MSTMTIAQAINNAISLEMENDPNVVLLGEDVGKTGGVLGITQGLQEKFGEKRVLDTPISESGFLGAAVGAAATGLRPIVDLMFIDFIGVAMDQLFNQCARHRSIEGQDHMTMHIIRNNTWHQACGSSLYPWFIKQLDEGERKQHQHKNDAGQ